MKTRNAYPQHAMPLCRLFAAAFFFFAALTLHAQEAGGADSWGHEPIAYLDSSGSSDKERAITAPTPASALGMRTAQPHFTLEAPYTSLEDYMKKAMRFPDEERIRCTSGLVKVQFDILPSGDIANVAVISSPSPAFSEEALRMVAEMPQWEPAYRDGVPVKVRQQVNIRFALR